MAGNAAGGGSSVQRHGEEQQAGAVARVAAEKALWTVLDAAISFEQRQWAVLAQLRIGLVLCLVHGLLLAGLLQCVLDHLGPEVRCLYLLQIPKSICRPWVYGARPLTSDLGCCQCWRVLRCAGAGGGTGAPDTSCAQTTSCWTMTISLYVCGSGGRRFALASNAQGCDDETLVAASHTATCFCSISSLIHLAGVPMGDRASVSPVPLEQVRFYTPDPKSACQPRAFARSM